MSETSAEDRIDLLEVCDVLAYSPSVLDEFDRTIRQQGFTGPSEIPKLVLLSLYTRFLEKPVSLVIKGPSSSGKSYALEMALKLIPPTAYETFSGMSDKALVHASNLNLKHR